MIGVFHFVLIDDLVENNDLTAIMAKATESTFGGYASQ